MYELMWDVKEFVNSPDFNTVDPFVYSMNIG